MNVLIADKFETTGVEGLKRIGCSVSPDADLSGDSLREALASNGCEILIVRSTQVRAEMIESAKDLKLIIRAGSGYNTIDIEAAKEKGVKVANAPGMNATAVAELTVGLMLALDRRIVHNTVDLRKGVWAKKEYSKARGLKGRTLGIVGLGRIGLLIARRAAAFEMKLVYADVVRNNEAEDQLGICKVELDELIRQSDFISLHVPLDDRTRHLFDAEKFAMMKPTAFLINCSRGEVVDTQALAQAIKQRKIAGAGLDVYENEPGASDTTFADPVVEVDMVYGTHHIGASTEQAQVAVAEEVVRVIDHYKKTGELLHWVNP